MIKKIDTFNIVNKKVLIRVDFNVPINNGHILSDFRLNAVFSTIEFCLKGNAKVILMSHLGRPKGKELKLSLAPVFDYLCSKFPNNKVFFSNDCISDESINKSNSLNSGEINLLENLRYYDEELSNSDSFAHMLSKHGDIYINEAFGTSHRMHASNSAILKYFPNNKGIGFLMNKELEYLSNIDLNNDGLALLLGGAKVSTKLGMIKYFLNRASYIIIGGAMSFTFLKALGYNVGKSLVEENMIDEAKSILNESKKTNTDIILPRDIICSDEFSNDARSKSRKISEIKNEELGLDIGIETIKEFEGVLQDSSVVIWNGPMGVFEMEPFKVGTNDLANKISNLTKTGKIVSIVGGGDTASAVINMGIESSFTHVSTGGGASLELLSGIELQLFKSWRNYD